MVIVVVVSVPSFCTGTWKDSETQPHISTFLCITMTQSFLHISTGQPTSSCRVHPVVALSVLDHFMRRRDGQTRVIGTLLGAEKDGVVHIKSSFPVPHTEDAEVCTIIPF